MRFGTALFLLLCAPAALAQLCDPATSDEVCPDTTDWHRYFPLQVGNQWQYQNDFFDEPVAHWSWAIIGQTEVGGQTYFELERCEEADDGSAICAEPMLLRYDDEHELIVRRTDGGEAWWDVLPCNIGGAFNTGTSFDVPQECTGPAAGFGPVSTQGGYDATVAVPPDEVTGDTRKEFAMYPGTGPEMYAGLGVTKHYYDLQENPTQLVYAYVGGKQVGTPAFASCDPSALGDDDVCPDTTEWRRYFPLAVGNQWQYREAIDVDEVIYWGWRITGETEVSGRTYFELERCDEAEDGSVMCNELSLIRYDDEHARVVQYDEDGDTWWGLPCDLALPFGGIPQTESGFYECDDVPGEEPYYLGAWGTYGASITVGSDVAAGDTWKAIGTPVMTWTEFYAGIGPVEYEDELHPEATRLTYARVDGVEYGTPAFVFPTAGEQGAAQPVATGFTAAFPNPARGAMQAQYTLADPQTVTLELIDLLGRRVRETELGPQSSGAHDVRLDLGGLRPGLYVLRLRGDAGARDTQRVVVVR